MTPLLLAFALGSQTLKDVPYVPNGSVRQRLDLYLPEGGTSRPLIVYIHGGAFMFGSKQSPLLPKRLLAKGYAIASLDYRLSGDARFPAAVEDCKAAVRFLRAHAAQYGLNPKQFVAWGESAGANLAAMLGTTGSTKTLDVGANLEQSSAVQAVVDYYGPTDFLRMDEQAIPDGQKHDPANSPESLYLGAQLSKVPAIANQASPVTYVSRNSPPFFVAHGTHDHMVPFGQSEELVAALKKAGVRVEFQPVPGADHVFQGITDEQQTALDEATDRFLQTVTGLPR